MNIDTKKTVMTVTRKRKGILVNEDEWYQLKVFCARNKLFIVEKAGEIIEEWVAENCHEQSP